MATSIVRIQELSQTQGGTTKAKITGVWHLVNKKLDAPPKNVDVEVEIGNWHTPDGKDIPTIERWRAANSAQMSPPQQAPAQRAQAETPAYIEEASLRYISNVVGQAIAAKTITEPGQVLAWFNAAKLSLEGKRASEPFDDNVPTNASKGSW